MPAAPVRSTGRGGRRKRVLIVNAFFDEYRRTSGSPYRVPRAMAPIFLAGAIASELCDVRVYSEQHSGVLRDLELLAWPDMLVLTGLTNGFDRMLHLAAYARTLNPAVVVVAGGPAIRVLPRRAREFFDYACTGDIEELQAVVAEVFGPDHVAADPFPRFDLAPPSRLLGYVESSRACNFRCSFCSLTAEKAHYIKYDLEGIRRQILAVGQKQIVFIDNNFYGNDRDFFQARVEMLGELRRAGLIRGWSALVTGDFFSRPENLDLVRRAGCVSLFSGVESFDTETLRSFNKRQNTLTPQVEMIRNCLEAGIFFTYGIMLDPAARHIADLRREIEFILDTPEISLPAFFTLPITLLGTPYFRDCLRDGLVLPNIRLRDLDGLTLTVQPL
ncbi:MAG TPA: radical SAM protein, partial [Dongiaceae bacterium]